jgi:hypothetical protein
VRGLKWWLIVPALFGAAAGGVLLGFDRWALGVGALAGTAAALALSYPTRRDR